MRRRDLHHSGRRKRERNEAFFRPGDARHVAIKTVLFWLSGGMTMIDQINGLASGLGTRLTGSDGLHVVRQHGGRSIDVNIFSHHNRKLDSTVIPSSM